MKINVIYNIRSTNYKDTLSQLEEILLNRKLNFKSFELNKMEHYGDFTIVIGGDGTLLKASKFYSEFKTPVLGVNVGRLGFLSQSQDVLSVVETILNNDFYTEERLMLQAYNKLALNDVVIKGCDPSRTSKFYLDINGKEVCDYIADGLIISTPTGSTAYGLSAGGPVISPSIQAITIVPICPHTLNARPLVIPVNETITVRTADKLLSVSIDGFENDKCIEKITIEKADRSAILAFPNSNSFYEVLRNKLHWGLSPSSY